MACACLGWDRRWLVRPTSIYPSRGLALRTLARTIALVLGLVVLLAPAAPVPVVRAALVPQPAAAAVTGRETAPGRTRPYIVVMRPTVADGERASRRTETRLRSRLVSRAIGRSAPGVTVHHRYTSAMGGFAADLTLAGGRLQSSGAGLEIARGHATLAPAIDTLPLRGPPAR